jgi:serine protease AprX
LPKTGLSLELLRSSNVDEIRGKINDRLQSEKIISPNYKHVDGTSFAAPIVCSVIAQMLEANDNLPPAKIKEILTQTAKTLPNYPSEPQGFGIVQATAAVEAAAVATL